ncbi:MAG TPA: FkbM family methyltransferase [Flavisolibacter sp.]|jgi:FkbM family methyltransferase|nr:FkbM family methyltransferase [Flavisolibacter sp.]
MKQRIKRFLQEKHLYTRIKYSPVFHLYKTIFKPGERKRERREISFYHSFLPATNLIFDIGGYDGHKTAAFLHIADKVVCCEPDVTNFDVLKTRFRHQRNRVFLENVALGAEQGTGTMFLHHDASAFNTLNPKFKEITESDNLQKWNEKIRFQKTVPVTTTTLDNLISKYGHPYFIKIDVEGYELEVLKGLSKPVPFLSIECLLPDFSDELQQNIQLFLHLDAKAQFNMAVDEKLLFEKFISHTDLLNYVAYFNQHHFELIVRMNA